MNKLAIIGNLTADPQLRTTQQGLSVCDFTVAVNRRKKADGTQDTDYFRVTVWRQLGESCAKYLSKGKKVYVSGPVSVRTYKAQNGDTRASLEVIAEDVEFLTPRDDQGQYSAPAQNSQNTGFTPVTNDNDLPF